MKTKTAITAGTLLTPLERIDCPLVLIEDGKITAVSSRNESELPLNARHIDYPELVLAPGLIDIHIHGGSGHDVMEADDAALAAIEAGMARHGVTSYLPTTVTAPEDGILRALQHLGKSISRNGRTKRSRPLGIHLEGPFISHAKRGVHPPENLVSPSKELFGKYWEASAGTIRMMTIAPELAGASETIAEAKKLGVHSSIGHSNATYAQAMQGIMAGADHATHTFNAMRPLDHREPGILGAVLTDDRLSADLIADGVHVDPSLVKLFLEAKGTERAILITDAISATGMPDGMYKLGGFEVEVNGDRCEYQGKLAGSVLTLDRAVRNVMSFAGWELQAALRLVTLNPARLLGAMGSKGMVAAGCDADLVVLSPAGNIVETIIAGEPCL
ncbi:MAG TPA: N-acetylglucosamine-6-phosphate deacetylase [Terriglobales bacterium]